VFLPDAALLVDGEENPSSLTPRSRQAISFDEYLVQGEPATRKQSRGRGKAAYDEGRRQRRMRVIGRSRP